MDREESVRFAKKYVEDTLSFFGLNVDVYATINDDVIELAVPNTYLTNLLIGHNGENLRSLQTLLRITLANKNATLERVNLDIGDYKKRHNDQLAEKAKKWAKAVIETGNPKVLPYMNPADRRVVHQALTDYSELTTQSEGEGRERHIVIKQLKSEINETE